MPVVGHDGLEEVVLVADLVRGRGRGRVRVRVWVWVWVWVKGER